MRINRRLMLLVAVPLVVAVAFSALALAPATARVVQVHRLTAMVELGSAVGELAHHVQRERTAATALVAGQGDEAALRSGSIATDAGIARFREQRGRLPSVSGNAGSVLDRLERSLGTLPSLRAQARSRSSSLSALVFGYRIIIADLIDYRESVAQTDGVTAEVADHIRAAAALSRAAEHVGRQQVTVMRALAGGGFTPASLRTFDATRLGYTESTGTLFDLGPPQWRAWLERTLSGTKALQAQRLEDRVGRSTPDQPLTVSPRAWREATSDRLALLRSVERRIDTAVLATVTDMRASYAWWAGVQAVLVLLTLVGALVLATRIGRVMVRRLQGLRDAAHDVAHQRLPQLMAELSRPGAFGDAAPEEIAEQSGSPVRTTGRDEIGEVGEAFNSVHYETVRLAVQQARSREQLAETLVGVARRGAQLTGVMVSELDAVQRDEADPERMKALFALDHLAIRMERNTNNLLVLGGYGHGRVRSADAPCSTVIRAAAQQIEQFGRVELDRVDADIGIAARVAHDLAHLLAELLDNATRFSPPDRQVRVAAWRLMDRAVMQVVDEGLGIGAERRAELNAELAEPRPDIGTVRSMGLHVVARLAARHGIGVELRESTGPGTIAEITLPPSVLVAPPQGTGSGPRDGAGGIREADAQGGHSRARDGGADAEEPARARAPAGPAARVAGVSSSGLPLRRRLPPEQRPGAGGRDGTGQRAASAPKPPPRHRDSRHISDVLTAYAQGISRSASRRERTAGPETDRPAHDTTQRST